MKFVNLDESEIIEQPLEKVIARPDYSPIEFGYDDLCSLDSVSVDGIHPSGDDSDLILPPSVNKINSCFKSEYFKISNLFSEILTYELRKQALENLQLFDIINDLVKNSQNKLQFYKEENNTASIITSHVKDDGLGVHTDSVEVGVDNCIRLRSEEDERGHISEIKITPDKIVIDASDVYIQNKPFIQSLDEINNNLVITKGSGTNSSLQINAPGSKASGTNSLAVGMDAVASGDYSVAMGRGCSATGRGSVALGGTIISIKLTGDKGAVRYLLSINSIIAEYLPGFSLVKTSDLTTPVATIIASEVINDVVYITVDKTLSSSSALSNTTFGLIGNRASGAGSIALGAGLLSSNLNSIVEGWMTVATGSYSHAEGSYNIAKGYSSHAEGGYSIAEGLRSHTEGYYTVAEEASSHAEGARSLASGDASHAEGYGTIASGDYSHAEGSSIYNIYLTGNSSTYQINYGSNILNTFHFIRRCQGASIIEYTNFTKIAVINSIDLSKDGYTVTVVTDVDLGELSNYKCGVAVNIASGQSSHTENAALSSGKESHAGGWSLSTNECSFSHGYDCVADGKVSTSFGTNTYSQNNSEFALGRSNHSHTGETLAEQTLFSVGYGDFEQINMSKRIEQQLPLPAPEDGTNALEIMLNGDIWLGGYEEGVKLFEGETKELNTYTKEELDVELNNKIESTKNELSTSIDSKAPLEGYAPNLKVRFSDGLVGRIETIPHEIGKIAPTAGISVDDNSATIERIKGESVVWNQLNNIVQFNGTIYADRTYFTTMQIKIKPGIYCIKCHVDTDVAIKGASFLIWDGLSNTFTPGTVPTNNTFYYIVHVPVDGTGSLNVTYNTIDENKPFSSITYLYNLTKMFGAGNEPTTIEEFEARKPLGVSNEYNEGTIVSFQGGDIKSVGFNAWDEEWENGAFSIVTGNNTINDQIRSVNYIPIIPNGIYKITCKGKCSALWWLFYDVNKQLITGASIDGVTNSHNGFNIINKVFQVPSSACFARFYATADYGSTYNHDICLHLVHSGYRNGDYEPYVDDIHPLPNIKSIKDSNGDALFPYGLLSAGSVHDEITTTKAIKRIGVVDMGDVCYIQNDSIDGLRIYIPEAKHGINLISTKYTASVPNRIDKTIYFNDTYYGDHKGVVYDSTYSTVQDRLSAMSGVLLYYELAEPIEVDLPEPLNMTYEAWDFGTEELVVSEPSTSLKGEVIYHFNAVDRIRENSRNIDNLVSSTLRKTPLTLTESEKEQARTNIEALKELTLTVKDNGNIVISNIQGLTKEFMPATPSGDPMHYAYETAGAVYNATTAFIVKDAPWKDMVDTIEDKAKWGFDVVDANQVKQMTIGGTTYNYVQTTRTSPEGTTEPRYFLVGQASDGTWVEDETKVLHLPGHWYLVGLGDITNKEMRRILDEKEVKYRWDKTRGGQATKARTTIPVNNVTNIDMINTFSTPYGIMAESLCVTSIHLFKAIQKAQALSINPTGVSNKTRYIQTCKDKSGTPFSEAHVVSFINLTQNCNISNVPLLSKPSIIYTINNATPTTSITITLHADRYAQLSEDADIVAALQAKNTALEGTGGSISLVSA